MNKNKQYELVVSLVLLIGICLGVVGNKLITKETVCIPCPDCICKETLQKECPNCVCEESIIPEKVFCNKPSKYECKPLGTLNANVSSIKVICSNREEKIWLCKEDRWA